MFHDNIRGLFRRCSIQLILIGLLLTTAGCKRQEAALQSRQIGNQVWMTDNLDTDHYRNGEKIREAQSIEAWNDAISRQEGAWCYYDHDRTIRLYNWFAVADPRGLAPVGWRVPTDADWKELEKRTNGKGFETKFSGSRNCLGHFFGKGSTAFFWSATASGEFDAWNREISVESGKLQRVSIAKGLGLSVRCVRDSDE